MGLTSGFLTSALHQPVLGGDVLLEMPACKALHLRYGFGIRAFDLRLVPSYMELHTLWYGLRARVVTDS